MVLEHLKFFSLRTLILPGSERVASFSKRLAAQLSSVERSATLRLLLFGLKLALTKNRIARVFSTFLEDDANTFPMSLSFDVPDATKELPDLAFSLYGQLLAKADSTFLVDDVKVRSDNPSFCLTPPANYDRGTSIAVSDCSSLLIFVLARRGRQ